MSSLRHTEKYKIGFMCIHQVHRVKPSLGMQDPSLTVGGVFPGVFEARKVTVNELHVRTFQCSPHPVAWRKSQLGGRVITLRDKVPRRNLIEKF